MEKVGNVVEYDNLKWKIKIASKVYPEKKWSPQIIVARRILNNGKLGKESISYNHDRMLETIHR